MGRRYKQLSLEDRCEIARLQSDRLSVRQIAAALDRPASTISRELRRNRGREVGYKPSYAHEQTRARRWAGSRLERDPALRRAVLGLLAQGWSPEQVAGRMAREAGRRVISYESIYRSSMPRSPAPRTIAGVAICRAARANAGSAAGVAAARQASSKAGFPYQNGL
jgi:IS30 family transposase